jgi:crossover junction endodeoxyribonuclease RusA
MSAIELPWPPKELRPNASSPGNWRRKSEAAKSYRNACYWLSVKQRIVLPAEGEITLSLSFLPPDNRRRDLDNMLAAFKAGLDGFSDAHEVNDHRFALLLRRGEPVKHGCVRIMVA